MSSRTNVSSVKATLSLTPWLDVVRKLIAVENFCTRDVCNRSYNTQISADIAKPQILGGMKMRHNFHLGRRWYERGLPTQRMPSIGIGEGDGLIIFTIVILFRGGPCRTMRIFPSGLNFIQDSPSSCSKGETLPCTSMPMSTCRGWPLLNQ